MHPARNVQRLLREKKDCISKDLAVWPNQYVPAGMGKCVWDWVLRVQDKGGRAWSWIKEGFSMSEHSSTTENLTHYQEPQKTELTLRQTPKPEWRLKTWAKKQTVLSEVAMPELLWQKKKQSKSHRNGQVRVAEACQGQLENPSVDSVLQEGLKDIPLTKTIRNVLVRRVSSSLRSSPLCRSGLMVGNPTEWALLIPINITKFQNNKEHVAAVNH